MAHEQLKDHADAVSDQVKQLARLHRVAAPRAQEGDHRAPVPAEAARRQHRRHLRARSRSSRGSATIFEDQGVEPSGQERYIADTFCSRAADRVRGRFEQIESNDDERMTAIAKLAYKRGEYGYALFED